MCFDGATMPKRRRGLAGRMQAVLQHPQWSLNPRMRIGTSVAEPLDVSVQVQILNLIKDLQREYGFGALFISHDLGAVRYVADRIAVLKPGRVVETAETEVFYRGPEHEYSRRLLEAL